MMVGSAAITELLLDAGASLSLAAGYALTPLDAAVVHDRPDVCRLLLSYHADPNEVNADGCSALQVGLCDRHSDISSHKRYFIAFSLFSYVSHSSNIMFDECCTFMFLSRHASSVYI